MNLPKTLYKNLRHYYSLLFPYEVKTFDECISEFKYYRDYNYKKLPCKSFHPLINKAFKDFSKTRIEHEYVMSLTGNIIKEPFQGWIIADNKIIQPSIPYSYWYEKWAQHPLPNKFDKHFKLIKKVKIPELISTDFIFRFGTNYFHFFHSFITQLILLKNTGISLDTPISVPSKFFNSKFFKEALQTFPSLSRCNFIPGDKYFIQSERVHFAKSNPYTTTHYQEILNWLNISASSEGNNKIFLKRAKNRIRRLSNQNEIISLCMQYGYTPIDNEDLSLKEQIQLYQSTSHLIATHGAGITNTLFRFPKNMELIEIFPANFIFPGYYTLFNERKMKYKSLVGTNELNKEFYINKKHLEKKLNETI